MPTVQQPRRGATRRVLKAAGLALGAVLVSSQAQGAYAFFDADPTAGSTCDGATVQVNSEPNGDGNCGCKRGYSDQQGFGRSVPAAPAPLDCRYCAPEYYLKTASGGVGSVCGFIDVIKLHSTTVNAVNIGADVIVSSLAQAPTSANDGDFCAAGHYGTATSFGGTGCTACPFGGSSDAGSSAVTDCDPDCSETNTNSGAVADGFGTCQCAANYYGSPEDAMGGTSYAASAGCTACPAGGTSTAGTASSSGCTGASPTTADSAGATTPIAVALATAAAVPLLL